MNLYRIKIYPGSGIMSPWHSDTIMGSLCWSILHEYGSGELEHFIADCRKGEHPFVVSNCFPEDLLPKPLAGGLIPDKQRTKSEALQELSEKELFNNTGLVDLSEFNALTGSKSIRISRKEDREYVVGVMHNTISRLNNISHHYEQEETYYKAEYLSLYARIMPGREEKFVNALKAMALRGFGRRVSIGKGTFRVGEMELFSHFKNAEKPNSVVMLSNYVPCADDPVCGYYDAFVKYGKLGYLYSHLPNPHKKPVLMLRPGAVFWTDKPAGVYGRIIDGISAEKKEVVHFGCSLAIPAMIEKPELGPGAYILPASPAG